MMIFRKITSIIVLCVLLSNDVIYGAHGGKNKGEVDQEDQSIEKTSQGWGGWLLHKVHSSSDFLKQRDELIKLIEALMHIPYVYTIDSQNTKVIKMAITLAATANASRLLRILSVPQNVPVAKVLLWDLPKLGGYAFSGLYDFVRFMDAQKVIERNKTDAEKLKSFKFNQGIQLALEIVLRIFSLISEYEANYANSNSAYFLSIGASELADLVSLWRLLSRYVTYFMYTNENEFTFNFTIGQKHEKETNDYAQESLPEEQQLEEGIDKPDAKVIIPLGIEQPA